MPRKCHCKSRSLCGASFGLRQHVCGGQITPLVPGAVGSVTAPPNCDMDMFRADQGGVWLPVSASTGVVVYTQSARSLLPAVGSSFVPRNPAFPCAGSDVGRPLVDRARLWLIRGPGLTGVAVGR